MTDSDATSNGGVLQTRRIVKDVISMVSKRPRHVMQDDQNLENTRNGSDRSGTSSLSIRWDIIGFYGCFGGYIMAMISGYLAHQDWVPVWVGIGITLGLIGIVGDKYA